MSAIRLEPARQRRVLALMGVDVYAPRAAAPLKALGVLGDRDDPLVVAVVRAVGLDPGQVAFAGAAGRAPKAAHTIRFGSAGIPLPDAVHLPPLDRLRADGAAKREAWRVLRRLASKLAES